MGPGGGSSLDLDAQVCSAICKRRIDTVYSAQGDCIGPVEPLVSLELLVLTVWRAEKLRIWWTGRMPVISETGLVACSEPAVGYPPILDRVLGEMLEQSFVCSYISSMAEKFQLEEWEAKLGAALRKKCSFRLALSSSLSDWRKKDRPCVELSWENSVFY